MIKGNESIFSTAAFGLLAAALIWTALAPSRPALRHYGPTLPHRLSDEIGRSCRQGALVHIHDAMLAASERDRCAKARDDRRFQIDDLIQQIRSADAAQAQTELAYQSGLISDFQTVGGFLTLLAAAAAAYYARIAAAETKREADAAERAIATNTRLSEAQVRCYLSFAEARFQLNGQCPIFQVQVKNSGQSPARRMRVRYGFRVGNPINSDVGSFELFEHDTIEDVPAQEAVWLSPWCPSLPLPPIGESSTNFEILEIVLKVEILAEDVFGQIVSAAQCFIHNAGEISDRVVYDLQFLSAGNGVLRSDRESRAH